MVRRPAQDPQVRRLRDVLTVRQWGESLLAEGIMHGGLAAQAMRGDDGTVFCQA